MFTYLHNWMICECVILSIESVYLTSMLPRIVAPGCYICVHLHFLIMQQPLFYVHSWIIYECVMLQMNTHNHLKRWLLRVLASINQRSCLLNNLYCSVNSWLTVHPPNYNVLGCSYVTYKYPNPPYLSIVQLLMLFL